MTDKANRVRFFEKTFLVANISPEVVLGMLFLEDLHHREGPPNYQTRLASG